MDAPGELFPTLTALAESRVALKRAQTAVIVVYLGGFSQMVYREKEWAILSKSGA
jgi:hypothetical protein